MTLSLVRMCFFSRDQRSRSSKLTVVGKPTFGKPKQEKLYRFGKKTTSKKSSRHVLSKPITVFSTSDLTFTSPKLCITCPKTMGPLRRVASTPFRSPAPTPSPAARALWPWRATRWSKPRVMAASTFSLRWSIYLYQKHATNMQQTLFFFFLDVKFLYSILVFHLYFGRFCFVGFHFFGLFVLFPEFSFFSLTFCRTYFGNSWTSFWLVEYKQKESRFKIDPRVKKNRFKNWKWLKYVEVRPAFFFCCLTCKKFTSPFARKTFTVGSAGSAGATVIYGALTVGDSTGAPHSFVRKDDRVTNGSLCYFILNQWLIVMTYLLNGKGFDKLGGTNLWTTWPLPSQEPPQPPCTVRWLRWVPSVLPMRSSGQHQHFTWLRHGLEMHRL